jgi:hypothetical protein
MEREIKVVYDTGRFDRAYKRLPPNLREAMMNIVHLLSQPIPPKHLHYERVKSNPKWRSVRMDNRSGYRVIFYEEGEYRVIAWVDAHDDAYEWARKNEPCFNKYGEFEVVSEEEIPAPPVVVPSAAETVDSSMFPFVAYDVEILRKLGAPDEEWARRLQKLEKEALEVELESMRQQGLITEPAYERLYLLASGEDLRKLLPPAQLNLMVEEQLRNSVERGVLWQPEDWEELENYLQYTWQRWLVFLNPSQREMSRRQFNGPARITGGPGTGKTIVALHRAKELAKRYAPQKIFLTTFTKALARELNRRTEILIRSRPNLTIQNLDRFVNESIRNIRRSVTVLYREEELKKLTRFDALSAEYSSRFPPKFIWDEWQQVVDAWNISSEEEYLEFNREGRKRALKPEERRALWRIFEQMRNNLRKAGVMTSNQACYALAHHFRGKPPFRCVIADEAQDFGPAQMHLLQSLAPADEPDNLFFCLDASQRIYARSVPWTRYKIDVRGRSKRLRINYRNTLEIQQQAEKVLPVAKQIELAKQLDDPEVVQEALKSGWRPIPVMRNPDCPPLLQPCKSRADEAQKLKEWIRQCHYDGIKYNEIAVVARTKEAVNEIVSHVLRELGLSACALEQEALETQIYVDTAHAIKGLEVRAVAIVAAEHIPLESISRSEEDEDALQQERNLLYTAMTRPRERLYISWTGSGSPFLQEE